jgi:hypothetical protein
MARKSRGSIAVASRPPRRVEDETDQVGSIVAAGHHLGGQGGHQVSAVGGQPALAVVEDDAGPEDQVLDEILVSFEDGPLRDVGQRDNGLFGNGQLGGLGALGGAGPLGLGVTGRPGRRLEGAGRDPGSGLEALEAGDLVLELLDALLLETDLILKLLDSLLLESDDIKQLQDQRRAFGLGYVGQEDPHDRIRPATSWPTCPGLLRSYYRSRPVGELGTASEYGSRSDDRCSMAGSSSSHDAVVALSLQGTQFATGPWSNVASHLLTSINGDISSWVACPTGPNATPTGRDLAEEDRRPDRPDASGLEADRVR